MITRLLLALLFFFVAAPHAISQETIEERLAAPFQSPLPMLRSSTVVSSHLVTVGDLFDNAGRYAETPVFRAPAPGTRGRVPSHHVLEALANAGIEDVDLGGLLEISVERAGVRMDSSDFEALIAQALHAELTDMRGENAGRYTLSLASTPAPVMVGAEHAASLSVELLAAPSGRSERFSALIRTPNGEEVVRLTGRAEHRVLVPVLGRSVARGDIIRASDLRLQDVAFNRTIGTPMLVDTADIIGQAARRTLRPGAPLNPDDLAEPTLVERQELVTLVYRHGALALSVRARSMDDGAMGQSIDVMNLQSDRVVRGVVAGRGLVHVLGPMQDIAAAQSILSTATTADVEPIQ